MTLQRYHVVFPAEHGVCTTLSLVSHKTKILQDLQQTLRSSVSSTSIAKCHTLGGVSGADSVEQAGACLAAPACLRTNNPVRWINREAIPETGIHTM